MSETKVNRDYQIEVLERNIEMIRAVMEWFDILLDDLENPSKPSITARRRTDKMVAQWLRDHRDELSVKDYYPKLKAVGALYDLELEELELELDKELTEGMKDMPVKEDHIQDEIYNTLISDGELAAKLKASQDKDADLGEDDVAWPAEDELKEFEEAHENNRLGQSIPTDGGVVAKTVVGVDPAVEDRTDCVDDVNDFIEKDQAEANE